MERGARRQQLRVILFCGAESRFGFAHLAPLLAHPQLDVAGVVFATTKRWRRFEGRLLGQRGMARWQKSVSWYKLRSVVWQLRQLAAGDRPQPRNLTREAKQACVQAGVRVLDEDDANSAQALQRFKTLSADFFICAAYPQIFQSGWLSLPARAAVNFHPSLLPRCRGANPVFWAIASGETVSGISSHLMTRRIDEGDVLARISIPILPRDDYYSLYQRILEIVPEAVNQAVECLVSGNCATPQDNAQATVFREPSERDRQIQWAAQSARQIDNLVRAAAGQAYFWVGRTKVYVSECAVGDAAVTPGSAATCPAGTVIDDRDGLTIRAADGVVRITQYFGVFGLGSRPIRPGLTLS